MDINLITKSAKLSKKAQISYAKKDEPEPKIKAISITIIVGTLIIFILSTLLWLTSVHYTKKYSLEEVKIKIKNQRMSEELEKAKSSHKNTEQEKNTLDFKLLAKNQLDNLFFHRIKSLPIFQKPSPKM